MNVCDVCEHPKRKTKEYGEGNPSSNKMSLCIRCASNMLTNELLYRDRTMTTREERIIRALIRIESGQGR